MGIYGMRDGVFTAKDLTVKNDLSIEGDMSFGDATTDTLTVTGAATFSNTITVGVDDTGYDVKMFGATAGAYLLWDESADDLMLVGAAGLSVAGTATLLGDCNITGDVAFGSRLLLTDSAVGGASNGSILKKQLIASEDYTGTTAGTMVKMYGEASATVSSGEFTGLYVTVKGLHTSPGHNASIISAHVHASNTTEIWAGLWLYGDMINGIKMSGSTLTNALDISEATAVTNLMTLPAASTAPCSGETTSDYTFTNTVKLSVLIGGTQYYLIADRS